ncbi:hypothetical protein QBC44DRAFT_359695 [Cladorrhinum sp. PSN332]|nr:hypothetical protein QBC44DRAFT_359695 [Cladorrhinum sp. PSN332]
MAPGSNFIMFEPLDSNNSEAVVLQNFPVTKTVEALKKSIAASIGGGVDWKSIFVVFETRELDQNHRALSHYQIQNGDTVFYVRNVAKKALEKNMKTVPTIYFLNSKDRASWTLKDVPLETTISKLRSRLAAEKNLDEGAHFLWGGKELKDGNQLSNYEIGDGSIILVCWTTTGG